MEKPKKFLKMSLRLNLALTIKFDLYDLHIKKNTCNIAKEDMLRCPLCHHDIEKNGFYQHLVIDGCAYQKKY